MADPFLAEIVMFGSNFAPRGWALTDGQLLPISSNSALFSLLGTIYGGDGRTSFALPDLRGRSPMHPGNGAGLSPRQLGQRGGSEQFTITNSNMPSHSHSMHAETGVGNSPDPSNNMLALSVAGNTYRPYNANADKTMASQAIGHTGGGQSIFKQSPFLAVNFIIAMQGIFPSRS